MDAHPKTRWTRTTLLGATALLALGAVLFLVVLLRGRRFDPEPPPGPDAFVLPALAVSSLNVEVRYSLKRLREDLERAVPESYGDLSERRSHPGNPGMSYAVEARRENLQLQTRDDRLFVSAVLEYQGRAWVRTPFGSELDASCEPRSGSGGMPRLRLELGTTIALDPEWRLRSDVQVVSVDPWSGEDRCRLVVPPFSVDATDLIMESVRATLEESSSEMDSLVAALDIRGRLDEPWRQMREPLALADDVWLLFDPLSVRRGDLGLVAAGGQAIEFSLSLQARPRVVVGARPASAGSASPMLEEGVVDEAFTLHVETRIDYDAATRLLNQTLRGQELQVAGRAVRVTDVFVWPASDGRLALELGVDGAVRGRLYLVGRPVLETAAEVVTVPDLRFSAATRSLLLRGAVWLVDAAFAERVRRYARWPVGGDLARVRSLAASGLDRSLSPGVILSGDVSRLSLQGVWPRPDAIVVRGSMEGTASLEIGPI